MKNTIKSIIEYAKLEMSKSERILGRKISKIFADEVSQNLLDEIQVDYYGELVSVIHISNVSVLDSHTLAVQPFDNDMVMPVEKSIAEYCLQLVTEIKNDKVFVSLPPLTDEIRKQKSELRADAYKKAKHSVLDIQKNSLEKLHSELLISEEEIKSGEAEIQSLTAEYLEKLYANIAMYC